MLAELIEGLVSADGPGFAVGLLSGESEPEFFYEGQCNQHRTPVSPETLWEAASLSKPVVALLAIARSTQDRELLTQPLATTAAAFGAVDDRRWDDLTLRHALTHTTGLPNWRRSGEQLAFESDPGSPGYSGEGYELLLAELSSRLATPAESLLNGHLERLNMGDSSFKPRLTDWSSVATGTTDAGQPVPKRPVDAATASGSLHTTTADYLRFVSAIARPGTITDDTIRAGARSMEVRAIEIFAGHGRTLGWAFTQTTLGDVLWQHGDNPGFKHVAAVRPATGDAVVVFTNCDSGQGLYREICKRFLQVEVW